MAKKPKLASEQKRNNPELLFDQLAGCFKSKPDVTISSEELRNNEIAKLFVDIGRLVVTDIHRIANALEKKNKK